ncbi:MAG: hypothetical protein ACRES5_34735 [Pseudomonas sp.]
MPTQFQVIDVFFVPGRQDFLAVVQVISGDLSQVRWPMRSPELSGEWSLTTMPLIEPDPDAEASENIAIGLDGPRELVAGMHLVDHDA